MGKVFISYRRKDSNFAHRLYEKLCERLHDRDEVFVDLNINKDDFVRALTDEVKACDVFVLVVTPNTFDPVRIQQPDDWIRKEVGMALKLHKPVALAIWEGTSLPTPASLPPELQPITRKQGITFHASYFKAAMEKLAYHVANISDGKVMLRDPQPHIQRTNQPAVHQQGSGNINAQGDNISINVGSKAQEAEARRKQQVRQQRDDDFDYYDASAEKSQSVAEIVFLALAGIFLLVGVLFLLTNNALLGVIAIAAALVLGVLGISRARKRR